MCASDEVEPGPRRLRLGPDQGLARVLRGLMLRAGRARVLAVGWGGFGPG